MNKKVALVIGGSSGIGLATARLLLQKGYTVFNASRRACPDERVFSIETDVSIDGAILNAVKKASAEGDLKVIVYSAGFSMACPVEYVEESRYRYLFEVNFFGVITTVKAAMAAMQERGGKIIAISSVASSVPIAYDPYYCASKAALEMFFHTVQMELEERNIRLSVVCPGGTATPFSFKREICQRGGEAMHKAARRLFEIEQGGMTAEEVARTVVRVCEKNNPPQIVASGASNKLVMAVAKCLPKRLLLRIAQKVFL
ncbi:MAG: SDR family NAD(P)-dependent oxidoreductase [Clostridia bacterium]|nr:SDR family NAD(P)-dependent oxidoreductase [Clostridia bacterium]